jgi:antitoxin component of RelBE/YafQ-DinJ toxin-antitoxin module
MRKPFATSIDEDVQKNFKLICKELNININDVIEEFMQSVIEKRIVLTRGFIIDVRENKKK